MLINEKLQKYSQSVKWVTRLDCKLTSLHFVESTVWCTHSTFISTIFEKSIILLIHSTLWNAECYTTTNIVKTVSPRATTIIIPVLIPLHSRKLISVVSIHNKNCIYFLIVVEVCKSVHITSTSTRSRPISKVKRCRASPVLRWVTTWEALVMLFYWYIFLHNALIKVFEVNLKFKI